MKITLIGAKGRENRPIPVKRRDSCAHQQKEEEEEKSNW